jgi:hypothetical protein
VLITRHVADEEKDFCSDVSSWGQGDPCTILHCAATGSQVVLVNSILIVQCMCTNVNIVVERKFNGTD